MTHSPRKITAEPANQTGHRSIAGKVSATLRAASAPPPLIAAPAIQNSHRGSREKRPPRG
jgi:hypothetical protein